VVSESLFEKVVDAINAAKAIAYVICYEELIFASTDLALEVLDQL
jgi:hypothetical protein